MSPDRAESKTREKVRVSRTMRVTPERVFAELSDGWMFTIWVVGTSHMRDVDANWPQPGARLHHRLGAWPFGISDSTMVLECDPPHRLVLQARAWPAGEARIVLAIEPHPDGCKITMDEWPTNGPARIAHNPLGYWLIRRRNTETLQRLACLVENRRQYQPA
jgi:uncharacterized protein YndB with AHSA1/START domain